jgi:hypothetical protein
VKFFPDSQFPSVLGMLAAGLETIGLFRFQHTDRYLVPGYLQHMHSHASRTLLG